MTKVHHRSNRDARMLTYRVEQRLRQDTPTTAARDLGECVYVVRTPDRLIKIGYTTNLDRRIRNFGSVWSDVLLALPGTMEDEAALHERFRAYLARGREYYFPAIELMEWVNSERARLGVSAVA